LQNGRRHIYELETDFDAYGVSEGRFEVRHQAEGFKHGQGNILRTRIAVPILLIWKRRIDAKKNNTKIQEKIWDGDILS